MITNALWRPERAYGFNHRYCLHVRELRRNREIPVDRVAEIRKLGISSLSSWWPRLIAMKQSQYPLHRKQPHSFQFIWQVKTPTESSP